MPKFSNDPKRVTRIADFSTCRLYRYSLDIVWDKGKPMAAFIGLNPSTADEYKDDPTVRRCRGFAESWGCGGMRMLNLFAYRATIAAEMKAHPSPEGERNRLLTLLQDITGPRVACWGVHGRHRGRESAVVSELRGVGLQCLGVNRDGTPKHPLYLRGSSELVPFGAERCVAYGG